jgi:hypothetical protein
MTDMTAMIFATPIPITTQSTGLPTQRDDCLSGHRA